MRLCYVGSTSNESSTILFHFAVSFSASDQPRLTFAARYSTLRSVYREVRLDASCRASFPPFPPKSNLSRQTKKFLDRRGNALAAWLEVLFSDHSLAALGADLLASATAAPVAAEASPVCFPRSPDRQASAVAGGDGLSSGGGRVR